MINKQNGIAAIFKLGIIVLETNLIVVSEKITVNKPIVPSNDEIKINPASRSAKLRYAIKTDENDNFNELHEKFNYLIETENLSYNS